mgnify:CR=1 FL=1
MSWQSYIDNLLASGNIARAAIHNLDGSVLATSPGLNVSTKEALDLVQIITKGDPSSLYADGMRIGGMKYTFLRGDGIRSLYGRQGNGGVVVTKTNLTLVIGVYESPMVAGSGVAVVEHLADYLISTNQ